MPVLHRIFRHSACSVIAALLGVLMFAPACSSTGADRVGRSTTTPGTVSLLNYSGANRITLISESMLERIGIEGETHEERTRNFSSQLRGNAQTKVCRDDAVAGIAQYLEDNRFGEWSVDGSAPESHPVSEMGIELRIGDRSRYMLSPEGSDADPKQVIQFVEYVKVMLATYNEVHSYQAVDGINEFKQPELSERQREAMRSLGDIGLSIGGN